MLTHSWVGAHSAAARGDTWANEAMPAAVQVGAGQKRDGRHGRQADRVSKCTNLCSVTDTQVSVVSVCFSPAACTVPAMDVQKAAIQLRLSSIL